MKLLKVKINPHNRINIMCSICGELHIEALNYADLDKPFFYVCHECVNDYIKDDPNPFIYAMDKAQEQLNIKLSQPDNLAVLQRLKDK